MGTRVDNLVKIGHVVLEIATGNSRRACGFGIALAVWRVLVSESNGLMRHPAQFTCDCVNHSFCIYDKLQR